MNKHLLPKICPSCLSENPFKVVRFINAGGHLTFPYVCRHCYYKSNILEKKCDVLLALEKKGMELSDIELFNKL